MRRINVLVATDHAGYRGNLAGVGRYLLNTLPAINRREFEVTLVILRDAATLDTRLREAGVPVICLERRKFDPFALADFVRTIRQQRIDVVHTHQYATSNFGRIAGAITGVPVVLHSHGPDLHYPLYQRIADRLLTRGATRVLAVSPLVKEECARNRSIAVERITVIPNGVPLDAFKALPDEARQVLKERWGIPAHSLVVGTVTRLHEDKGCRVLLEAAARVLRRTSGVRFVLTGDGPLLHALKALASELGIADRVILTGFQEDVVGVLSMFDIMVLPSLLEGHPQTVLEAMAMGKAVIASSIGGVRETIVDGRDGLLVQPGDAPALAETIMDLLQDEARRARLGAAAHVRIRDFSLETHVQRIEDIYRQVALRAGRASR